MTQTQPTLYIIHGWTYKPEPWAEVVEELSRKHRIKAVFLRVPGLGVKSDQVFTIQDYVKWAKQHIPADSIALGHSNGGRILLNLAAQDQDYLRAMILLDSAGVWEKSAKRDLSRRLAKIFAPLKKLTFLRQVVHRVLGASDYAAAPENMKHTLANMLESDRKLQLVKVITPTAIIWGSDDKITPLRQGEQLHRALINSSLTIKKGWRHSHYLVSVPELSSEIAKQYYRLIKENQNVA